MYIQEKCLFELDNIIFFNVSIQEVLNLWLIWKIITILIKIFGWINRIFVGSAEPAELFVWFNQRWFFSYEFLRSRKHVCWLNQKSWVIGEYGLVRSTIFFRVYSLNLNQVKLLRILSDQDLESYGFDLVII